MIDELIEYKEYTDKSLLNDILEHNKKQRSSKKLINNRLKYISFIDGFSGLDRALTIVCKYFLNKYNNDKDIAFNALKAWMGLPYDSLNEEINDIAGYVNPSLIEFYKAKNPAMIDKIEKLKKQLLKKRFCEDIINDDSIAEKNNISTFNKISFNSIIYRCLNKPLSRKILVCKKPILDDVTNLKNKKITEKQYDYLLKLIAAYLKFNTKRLEEICIVKVDLNNWCLYNPDSSEIKKFSYKNLEFPITLNIYNKKSYYRLSKEIKENYFLVDIKDIEEKVEYGDIVYVDKGERSLMKKIEIENSNGIMNLLQELSDVS